MLARSTVSSDAAGPASQHPPPLEREREGSFPQRGAASRLARVWSQFAALPYRLRALLGVLYVYAETTDAPIVVRVAKTILAARTGQSRRGVDEQLEELAELVDGFRVVERSDRRAHVYELPPLVPDELAARRPSMLPAWREDVEATCLERALVGVLLARGAGTERGAWPSAAASRGTSLARQLGVSRATVFDTIARLERRGAIVTRQLTRGALLPDGSVVGKGAAVRYIRLDLLCRKRTNRILCDLRKGAPGPNFSGEVPPAEPGPQAPQNLDGTPRKAWTHPPAEPGPESLSADRALIGAETRGRAREVDAVLERAHALHAKAEPAPRFVADRERRRIVLERLGDGYTADELVRVVENAKRAGKWWETRCRVDAMLRSGDTIRELLDVNPIRAPRAAQPAAVVDQVKPELTEDERRAMIAHARSRLPFFARRRT